MKPFILLFFFLGFIPFVTAQTNPYEQEWAAIDTLEHFRQLDKAIIATEQLLQKTRKDSNYINAKAHYVKAFIFKSKYEIEIDLKQQDSITYVYCYLDVFEQLEQKLAAHTKTINDPIIKALLYSNIADISVKYQQDFYTCKGIAKRARLSRINTDGSYETIEDPYQDSLEQVFLKLQQRTSKYLKLAASITATKNVPAHFFNLLLENPTHAKDSFLNYSLHDLLVDNLIWHLTNQLPYTSYKKSAKHYPFRDSLAFIKAEKFIDFDFTVADETVRRIEVYKYYQELLRTHLKGNNRNLLAKFDYDRMHFGLRHNYDVISKTKGYYVKRLLEMEKNYADVPFGTTISYQVAKLLFDQNYSTINHSIYKSKWSRKRAHQICMDAIKRFPKSIGAQNCKMLINKIEQKELQLKMEAITPTNQAILAKVNSRNIDKLHCKLFSLPKDFHKKKRALTEIDYHHRDSAWIAYLSGLNSKTVKTWEQAIPLRGDFHNHSVEIKVPAQSTGAYLLVLSDKADFRYNNNGLVYAYFQVSDLAFIIRPRTLKKSFNELFIVNRKNGAPIEKAQVDFLDNKWKKIDTQKSNSDGYIKVESKKPLTYSIRIKKGEDQLFLDDKRLRYFDASQDREGNKNYLFTDKAIYRPGQTLQYKGILTNFKYNGQHKVVPNQQNKITFYDVNNQEIAHQYVTSNKFGAYSGTFTIPSSGLLGSMSLKDSLTNRSSSFHVEEYKKPTFNVNLKSKWRFGETVDTLEIYGIGKTFSAMPLAGATVNYLVTIADYYWDSNSDTLIVNQTHLNDKGIFFIQVEVPHKKGKYIERHYLNIHTEVIDLTGETQEFSTSTSRKNKHSIHWKKRINRRNFSVNFKAPSTIKRDKNSLIGTLQIAVKEANHQPNVSGTMIIEQLKTPTSPYIKRLWKFPDTTVVSNTAFKTDFPLYSYKNEQEYNIRNWEVLDTVYQIDFEEKQSKDWRLNTRKWQKGNYRIRWTAIDNYKKKHQKKAYFLLGDHLHLPPFNKSITTYNEERLSGMPNDTVSLELGSYFDDAHILMELESNRRVHQYQWLQPKRYQQIPIALTKEHQGNLHYRFSSIYNNRFHSINDYITVPWSSKELKVEYLTFRNKLEPGAKEEWTIKVSGFNGKTVASEILASMYDAALDQLTPHAWQFNLYRKNNYPSLQRWRSNDNICTRSFFVLEHPNWQPPRLEHQKWIQPSIKSPKSFLEFNAFWHQRFPTDKDSDGDGVPNDKDLEPHSIPNYPVDKNGRVIVPTFSIHFEDDQAEYLAHSIEKASSKAYFSIAEQNTNAGGSNRLLADSSFSTFVFENKNTDGSILIPSATENFDDVTIRTDLKESVFFYPHLKTDTNGTVSIKFTMSEALSKWKFMLAAHTKDLQTALSTKTLITQKKLMVMPSTPRFLRQGDVTEITTKVANLTENDVKGAVTLQLFNSITDEAVDDYFNNKNTIQNIEISKKDNIKVSWRLTIPEDWTSPIRYRIIAKTGDFSDGEQNQLPVISNKTLVTESMPILLHGNDKKNYSFDILNNIPSSKNQQHQFTLELSPNPAWDAVLSLPYLIEYPYECSEQLFSRFYANSLAHQIVTSTPKIKTIFEAWAATDVKHLSIDKLLANPSLKSTILEEMPWVINTPSKEQQKKHLGQLFDLQKMNKEFKKVRNKLLERQAKDGGFAWFNGGSSNSFITQYIVSGMAKLNHLGVNSLNKDKQVQKMLNKAMLYMDKGLVNNYQNLTRYYQKDKRRKKDKDAIILDDNLTYDVIQYLYAKSFYWDKHNIEKDTILSKSIRFYLEQTKLHWRKKSIYHQGMLALALHRINQHSNLAQTIVDSLRNQAVIHPNKGMYWQKNWGYYWHQLPIETQALMVEVFDEVAQDKEAVYQLKLWLLQNKKGNAWQSTKATTSACYVLMMTGDNWLENEKKISVKINGKGINHSTSEQDETGYFKIHWQKEDIKNNKLDIELSNPNSSPAFGAVYQQYFQDLDKIVSFEGNPLKIKKKLLLATKTTEGVLYKAIESADLKPGDLIKVSLEVSLQNDMEYLHLKDMRAAGFEPTTVLSGYKYQGGVGYYETTKDASTNFFFDYLKKGKYTFEYNLRVVHKGNFSNGITTIQSMYAPEFTAHSEGIRINVQ